MSCQVVHYYFAQLYKFLYVFVLKSIVWFIPLFTMYAMIDPDIFYKIMGYPIPRDGWRFFWLDGNFDWFGVSSKFYNRYFVHDQNNIFKEDLLDEGEDGISDNTAYISLFQDHIYDVLQNNLTDNSIFASKSNKQDDSFSWESKADYMEEFLGYIARYKWLYRSIPFVSHIYLCNSITFNTIKYSSDIDLLIIVKSNKMWLARFFSRFIFTILGIRVRGGHHKRMKFCLSFYVDQDHLNLYNIAIKPIDIYLIYWIAHLVPLYVENSLTIYDIYRQNSWIRNFLPNIDLKQNIFLSNEVFFGNSLLKEILQRCLDGYIGRFVGWLIKQIWMPILLYKAKQNPKNMRGLVIEDFMLKFHLDMRKKIYLFYKIASRDFVQTTKKPL